MTDSPDLDIEADQEVFERVNARVLNGIPREMEMSSSETRAYIRAAQRWHQAAVNLWNEKLRESQDAMRLHSADSKYIRNEAEQ